MKIKQLSILSTERLLYIHCGDDSVEDPPVPIPNTEVKLNCAESTWLDTAWEDRELPHFIFLVSSAVEHPAVNRRVVGPNPTRGAKKKTCFYKSFFMSNSQEFDYNSSL